MISHAVAGSRLPVGSSAMMKRGACTRARAMATHNAEVVTALRKRVVALEEGRIIRDEVGGAYHRED